MILSRPELLAAIRDEGLGFDPALSADQVGPTGVDLRLGPEFTVFEQAQGVQLSIAEGISGISAAQLWRTRELPEFDELGKRSTFVLAPGEFILARTLERVAIPAHLAGLVEGRSSYARLGLSMHQTAPWIHPGFDGHITLEIRNSGPFSIVLTPRLDKPVS